MYALEIYSGVGTGTTQEVLTAGEFTLRGWSHRINAAGKLTFTMHRFHSKATRENLRKHRQVRLYRKPRGGGAMVPVWYGYIEAEREIGDRKEISCVGMLDFFKKRYTQNSEVFDGQGSTEAFDLLNDTNTVGETGVTSGTGGVTSTKDLTISNGTVLSAWEQLAASHDAEFDIDSDTNFNFVSSLGSDKSSSIELTFRRDGQPGTNIDEIEIGEDAKDMVNRVIGKSSSSGGLTSTQNDTTSQAAYGDGTDDLILIEHKTFDNANDQDTLDSLTSSWVSQRANPLTDIQIQPSLMRRIYNPITNQRELSGVEYDDVEVGDLVTVNIITKNTSITQTKRVAELTVQVDSNLQERLRFTLSESGVFITAAFLDQTEIDDIKQRLKTLENAS